jgi:hypothetical protein
MISGSPIGLVYRQPAVLISVTGPKILVPGFLCPTLAQETGQAKRSLWNQ